MKTFRVFFAAASLLGIIMPAQSLLAYFDVAVKPQSSSTDSVSDKPQTSSDGYFYLEAGLASYGIKNGYFSSSTTGFAASAGWRMGQTGKIQNKIHLDYGYFNAKVYSDAYTTSKWKTMPLLLSYSACIPLKNLGLESVEALEGFELRITPSLGLVRIEEHYTYNSGYYTYTDKYSNAELAYGIGLGLTYHINKKFFVDFGWHWLRIETNDVSTMKKLSLTFGWKL